MRKLILTLAAIAAISLKHTKETKKEDLLSAYQLVDTTHFKKSVLKGLHEFIAQNPKIKMFVITSNGLYRKYPELENPGCNGCRRIINELFRIENAWMGSFEKGEFAVARNYPTQYFMMDGKIIFFPTEMDGCKDQKYYKKQYEKMLRKYSVFDVWARNYMLVYDIKDSIVFWSNFDRQSVDADTIGSFYRPFISRIQVTHMKMLDPNEE